jgi:tRNA uridine 5-carboxymethylaminomethyl modification enzyme
MTLKYDVIIVGGGHAGSEAAFAAANMGSKVLLAVTNLSCIAMMPCNPSMGGPGKGHLIREIHALGGQIGKHIDESYLQIRELNESRGPAVRALRAQCDKKKYHLNVKKKLEEHPNIWILQSEITELLHKEKQITGVKTITGLSYEAPCVILATGTFLNGKNILGSLKYDGGPAGESASTYLAESLKELDITIHRLQTATPPRILGTTINFHGLKPLGGQKDIPSFTGTPASREHRNCYLTYTNEKTIDVVKENLEHSPLKLGNITQHGPRHCPSIDRKIMRFPNQIEHQIFIEPESDTMNEWYLQGLTTALPPAIQEMIIHSCKGLEQCHIMRYGYAIEYDALDATQLRKTLEFKDVQGLYACGQINGTSGYEEAAAQGLIAGINAHLKAHEKPPFILDTTTSYLSCLIEELVTNPTPEPVRVTTGMSEFRLHFRTDNAEERLSHHGHKLGLIDTESYLERKNREIIIEKEVEQLKLFKITPSAINIQILKDLNSCRINNTVSLAELLTRPELDYHSCARFGYPCISNEELIPQIEIRVKYMQFFKKLYQRMEKTHHLDSMLLPDHYDYKSIKGLDEKEAQIFNKVQPSSIGQASRIQGVAQSATAILIQHFSLRSAIQ